MKLPTYYFSQCTTIHFYALSCLAWAAPVLLALVVVNFMLSAFIVCMPLFMLPTACCLGLLICRCYLCVCAKPYFLFVLHKLQRLITRNPIEDTNPDLGRMWLICPQGVATAPGLAKMYVSLSSGIDRWTWTWTLMFYWPTPGPAISFGNSLCKRPHGVCVMAIMKSPQLSGQCIKAKSV